MSASKRQQRAQRRNRDRIRHYLYGSDREGASACAAAFAGCAGAATRTP